MQVHFRKEVALRIGAVASDAHRVDPVAVRVALVLDVDPHRLQAEARPAARKLLNVLRRVRFDGVAVRVELLRAVLAKLDETNCEELHELPRVVLIR